MVCDERTLVAYLWGELDPAAAERFERHLVDCDQCWVAVAQDCQGRATAESLRELAPAPLRDRVRFAIQGEKGPAGRKASRRFRRATAAAATAIVAAAAVIGGFHGVGGRKGPSDPPSVAAVVRLAEAGVELETAPASRVRAGDQVLSVSRLDDRGTPVLVAHSNRPFPPPPGATPMLRADSPWVAARGQLGLVCFNRPHPVLLVARLPADQLMGMAEQLAQ